MSTKLTALALLIAAVAYGQGVTGGGAAAGAAINIAISSNSTPQTFTHNLHDIGPVVNCWDSAGVQMGSLADGANPAALAQVFNIHAAGGTSLTQTSISFTGTPTGGMCKFVTGSGQTGATGATGPSGPSGTSGPSGPTGVTGASGPTGATGGTGPSGPSGVSGPSGPTGTTGSTGSTGPSGPSGAGASGPSGPSGATGSAGFAYFGADTGAVSMTGSDVTLQSVAAPALPANGCWRLELNDFNSSGGGTTYKLFADATQILSFSQGSSGYGDIWTVLYCNTTAQTGQTLTQLSGCYFTSLSSASGGCAATYAQITTPTTPTGVNWASGHTLAWKANNSGGNTARAYWFHVVQE